MKRVIISCYLLAALVVCTFAQNAFATELYFLDGFTIYVEEGYGISEPEYVWLDEAFREVATFIINTPGDDRVNGTILFDNGIPLENMKDDLIPMIRMLYRDFAELVAMEVVGLLPEEGGDLIQFTYYYGVGELEFTGIIFLLHETPGFATACILSMPFPNMPLPDQELVIDALLENMRIEIEEAAG